MIMLLYLAIVFLTPFSLCSLVQVSGEGANNASITSLTMTDGQFKVHTHFFTVHHAYISSYYSLTRFSLLTLFFTLFVMTVEQSDPPSSLPSFCTSRPSKGKQRVQFEQGFIQGGGKGGISPKQHVPPPPPPPRDEATCRM